MKINHDDVIVDVLRTRKVRDCNDRMQRSSVSCIGNTIIYGNIGNFTCDRYK